MGSRRAFLHRAGRLAAVLAGCTLTAACERKPRSGKGSSVAPAESGESAGTCGDSAGLTAEDVRAREQLGYVAASPVPGTTCSTCQVWIDPEPGARCGGCVILAGPIDPEGYCTAWSPQTGT